MLNHIDYFEKLIVYVLHRKIRVNDEFGILKVVTVRLQTRKMEK